MGEAFELCNGPDAVSFLEQGDGGLVLFPHLFVRFAISFLPAEFASVGYILGPSGVEPVLDVTPFDGSELGKDRDEDGGKRIYCSVGL